MIIRYRKQRKEADIFAASAPKKERAALIAEYRGRMAYSDLFFAFFLGFLVIALAGPRWGIELTADYRRGMDVVLAFDLSRSMNARDGGTLSGSESRIERGLAIARNMALSLPGIRLGTAIGKGRGTLAVPLTYDTEAVISFLDSVDNFALTGTGTNLESLIDAASSAFRDNMPGKRSILLFSDGETLSGSLHAAANRAGQAGILLCAAGLGSDSGSRVPVEEGPSAPGGVLLSDNGSPVVSVRRAGLLKSTAENSGGIYVDGGRNDAAAILTDYYAALSEDSELNSRRREFKSRWQLFVLAALASLAVSRLLGFRIRKKRVTGIQAGNAAVFLLSGLVSLFGSSCSRMQGKLLIMEGNFYNNRGLYIDAISSYLQALEYGDAVPYAEYGLGSAYFALEESGAALERYAAAEESLNAPAADHQELRYRVKYNSGIIHFEKAEYEEAAAFFREALEIDGSRIEAKRNLELSLLTMERNSTPQEVSPSGTPRTGSTGEDSGSEFLFDYLRQKEREQWKSREWEKEDTVSGPDY
jgi:Ca-activated chloride channel family protein